MKTTNFCYINYLKLISVSKIQKIVTIYLNITYVGKVLFNHESKKTRIKNWNTRNVSSAQSYVGQTARSFDIRFKKHVKGI